MLSQAFKSTCITATGLLFALGLGGCHTAGVAGSPNPFGPSPSPGTPVIYIAQSGSPGSVTAYDPEGNLQTLGGAWTKLANPHAIVYDAGNGLLYVTNLTGNTVTAYDTTGNQQVLTGNFAGVNVPNGIAYDSSNGWLYVVNQGSNKVTAY